MPKIIYTAIYVRVSGEHQKEGYSLEDQLEKCLAFCQDHGWIVKPEHIYIEVKTASVYRERPKLNELRQASRRGEFQQLVMYKLDRFSRDPIHQEIVREDLAFHGVTIYTLQKDEHAEDNTALGSLIRHIYGFMAQLERESIVERTGNGRMKHVEHGNLLGGKPKYGYQWNEDHTQYVINPTEAGVVNMGFEMVDDGATINFIAEMFDQAGIPTRKGGKWNRSFLAQMLRDRDYIGEAYRFKRGYEKNGLKKRYYKRPQDEQVLVVGAVPAIVDRDLFNRVQLRLEQNKQSASRRNYNVEATLLRAGHMRCAHCLGAMNVRHTHEGKYSVYFCIKGNEWKRQANPIPECRYNSISALQVDPVVWEKVVALMRDPEQLRASIEALKIPDPTSQEKIPVDIRLKQVDEELNNLLEMGKNAKSRAALEKINAWITQAEKEKELLLREDELLEEQQKEWENAMFEVTKFESWCQGFLANCQEPTYQEKRRAIEMFGIRVFAFKYGHTPRFRIEVSPPSIVSVLS